MTTSESLALDTAERVFRDKCTDTVLVRADAGIWPQDLWSELEVFGLPLAMVHEDHGGIGIPLTEAHAILRLAGQVGLPLPIAETMLANWLLSVAGLAPLEGPATIADGNALELTPRDDSWRLIGTAKRVPWGRWASIVTLVEAQGVPHAVCVGREAVTVRGGANIANEPRDELTFECVLPPGAVAPVGGAVDLTAHLAAARCSQMAGAMERIAELSTAYALEREQFGRPIAKFQAVQQNLAILAEQVAAARAAAEMAAEAVEDMPLRRLAVASAKLRVGEAAGIVAGIAHQVHGAIGFTQEYRLHHLTRRLWSWREEYGNETVWAMELGQEMAMAGPDGLWAAITAI